MENEEEPGEEAHPPRGAWEGTSRRPGQEARTEAKGRPQGWGRWAGRQEGGSGEFTGYSLRGNSHRGRLWALGEGLGRWLAPHRESKAVTGTRGLVQCSHAIPSPEVNVGATQAQGSNHLHRAFCLGCQCQRGL